ncbi:hypothetical protein MAUB1S_07163 [Mycolicibacterium aubagnense]
MSLPDTRKTAASFARRAALFGLLAGVALVSACQVRPLYSNQPLSTGSTVGAREELASIAVKPVSSRYAQQVRNNLIFALTGGGERPNAPAYSLTLSVTESVISTASIQVAKDQDQPTAGTVIMTAAYTLTDAKTGKAVANGQRSISSSFDKPSQEFASYRAQIDAENRAARELAELLHLALAQDLAKPGAR